jgi:hypothetical protein
MNSFITLFNLERLFGWVLYNLVMMGITLAFLIVRVGLYGDDIEWSGPRVYSNAIIEPRAR